MIVDWISIRVVGVLDPQGSNDGQAGGIQLMEQSVPERQEGVSLPQSFPHQGGDFLVE
jgi:hypothetical protein